MNDDPESFETYLARVVRRLVERLAEDPDVHDWGVFDDIDPLTGQLGEIRLAAKVRRALDQRVGDLIARGSQRSEVLLDAVLGPPMAPRQATWKEIGNALGVSAQAAHRKYGHLPRREMPDVPASLTG